METLLADLIPNNEDLLSFLKKEIANINAETPKLQKSIWSYKDTILITYADQFREVGKSNLQSLDSFLKKDLQSMVSQVHILPFYPSSSDDGFSPISYKELDPDFGTWADIENISAGKMFDCVFNHMSSKSDLFQRALSGDKKKEEMFHVFSEEDFNVGSFQEDILKVVRPRVSPLFSKYKFGDEDKYVWTTFSEDQVDVNLSNPDMLKYIFESLFLYIRKGARVFRVDAVPFLWKELGTNCSHHQKTHSFVKLIRAIFDKLNPNLLLITESNVPHLENIEYWGDGTDEAHAIYNFSLAPLLIHAINFESNQYINQWASEVFKYVKSTSYLNFSATHDGIGVRGLEGIVPDEDVETLCQRVESKGGFVGKKLSRAGDVRPYELNITWASFMKEEGIPEEVFLNKLVNSQAIVMFFPGVAALYVHNFFGTENWHEGFEQSGIPRRLNRKKLSYPVNYTEFSKKVRDRTLELIKYKSSKPCFDPTASFELLSLNDKVLSFCRGTNEDKVMVLFNFSREAQIVKHLGKEYLLAAYQLYFENLN